MGYFQIYLYTQFVQDWEKSYEITGSFLNQKGVKGYSYNGYIGISEPLSHITVRFNFENDKAGKQDMEKVIANLLEKRLIIAKSEWSPFQTTQSVVRATEVSTKCAFAFKNWMKKNTEVLGYYFSSSENRVRFMSRFLVILLQQLGFKAHFEEYPIEADFIENIKKCAEHCAGHIREAFNQELDIVFMERVIHHFLNCVHISTSQEEPRVYGKIAYWEWLGNLLEKRRKNE